MLSSAIKLGRNMTKLTLGEFTREMSILHCKYYDEDFVELFLKIQNSFVRAKEIYGYINIDLGEISLIPGIDVKHGSISERGFLICLQHSQFSCIDYLDYYNALKKITHLYEPYTMEYNNAVKRVTSVEMSKIYNKHRIFISVLKMLGKLSKKERESALLVNKMYDGEFKLVRAKYESLII